MCGGIIFHPCYPIRALRQIRKSIQASVSTSNYRSFFSSSWLMMTSCPEASWDFLVMDSRSASTRIFSLVRLSAFFSPERTFPSNAGVRMRGDIFNVTFNWIIILQQTQNSSDNINPVAQINPSNVLNFGRLADRPLSIIMFYIQVTSREPSPSSCCPWELQTSSNTGSKPLKGTQSKFNHELLSCSSSL